MKAGRVRQWFCYCTNAKCKGGDPRWRCDDGTREFFVYGNGPVVCPECRQKGAVYPY